MIISLPPLSTLRQKKMFNFFFHVKTHTRSTFRLQLRRRRPLLRKKNYPPSSLGGPGYFFFITCCLFCSRCFLNFCAFSSRSSRSNRLPFLPFHINRNSLNCALCVGKWVFGFKREFQISSVYHRLNSISRKFHKR